MKNSLFFAYYLDKDTQVLFKNWFYIIPYSLFYEKYEKGTGKYHLSIIHLEKNKIDYVLIDQHQSNIANVISYKKHSLKNIFANYVNRIFATHSFSLNLITFSKNTNVDELVDTILVGSNSNQNRKDKVKNFIIETIKEYEKL